MYILTFLAIIFSTVLMIFTSGGLPYGVSTFTSLIDMPSLLILLVIAVPVVISSNLWKDFNNAFKIVLGKKAEYSLVTIRRAIEAVELMRKTLLFAGGFMFCEGCVIALLKLSDPASLGPNIAVSILTCLYSIMLNILLFPIVSRLNIKIIEFMQE